MNDITKTIAAFPQPSGLTFSFGRNWGPESTGFWGPGVDAFKGRTGGNAGLNNGMQGLWAAVTNDQALASFGAQFREALMGAPLEAAVQNAYGISVNKRNAVIFQDLPFRDITLSWTLRPRSATESRQWYDAIKKLKVQSAPKLKDDGAYWDVSECKFALTIDPGKSASDLDVEFVGPPETKILFQSHEMVITNIATDYTPNGFWSQHQDGWPTQVNLSISFMETQLAYNKNGQFLTNKDGLEVI